MPSAVQHWGGDGSIGSSPFGNSGSTPLYLCLPPFRGSVGNDHYFTITGGTYKEMTSTKEHLKHRDFVVQRHLYSVAQLGAGWKFQGTKPGSWHFLQS